ncbi:phytase [Sphingomonas profundi]|uniref:phytase n=1 Tax=Alterirhizorhabdus profundi TaxID=2681549 RepID=UPI0012E70D50|nr:phytase [Sphingomonas profundi]
MLFAQFAAAIAATALPSPLPTAIVGAVGETQAVASARDAADDPAIWRDRRHPERSLIVATDKQAGLNVYALDGRQISSLPAGRVNNVDIRVVRAGGRDRVIVAASDRNDRAAGKLALFELDTAAGRLTEIGRYPAAVGEAYGLCLYQPRRGPLYAFVVDKDGLVSQLRVDLAASAAPIVRRMKLATQSEGCVADDRTATLYVAEEDVGIWRFGAEPTAAVTGDLVAAADGQRLVADAEGLAIAARGRRGGWLVASSQGDSAYAVYRLPDIAYVGRFRIGPGATIGGTSDTDGIEIATAPFGGDRRGGIMIAQDGDNAPAAQNFKIVRWADIKAALRLR